MKKLLLMLLLTLAICVTGCGNEDADTDTSKKPQETLTTEDKDTAQENLTTEEKDTAQETLTTEDGNASVELDDYMAALKEKADALKSSLENDELIQSEMNAKAHELYQLWDGTLNYLWRQLKDTLPEDEFAKLLDEQRTWLTERDDKIEEAGKGLEGGSMYALIADTEGAKLTEERVYELYEMLK